MMPWTTVGSVKLVLDPDAVIAPGRYGFES
jgi:hypothetical protein